MELADDADGRIRWKYDGLGRPVHEALRTDRLDSQYLPDGYRDVLRHWEYEGLTTTYTNRNGEKIVSTTDLANLTVTELIVPPQGLTQSDWGYNALYDADGVTDANVFHQKTTTLHSDGSVKKIEEAWTGGQLDGDGSFVEYLYDPFGRAISVTQGQTFVGHVAPQSQITTQYDVGASPASPHQRKNLSTLSLDTTDNGQPDFVQVLQCLRWLNVELTKTRMIGHIRVTLGALAMSEAV